MRVGSAVREAAVKLIEDIVVTSLEAPGISVKQVTNVSKFVIAVLVSANVSVPATFAGVLVASSHTPA